MKNKYPDLLRNYSDLLKKIPKFDTKTMFPIMQEKNLGKKKEMLLEKKK
jgi:hypothetical protein